MCLKMYPRGLRFCPEIQVLGHPLDDVIETFHSIDIY